MRMDGANREMQKLKQQIGRESKLGRRDHDKGSFQEALSHYNRAYELSRELRDDKTERTCAFNLGAAYIASGNSKQGLELLHKAKPPDGQYDGESNGDLFFNIGLGYEKEADPTRAVEYFEYAFNEYKQERGNTDELKLQCLEKCIWIRQRKRQFNKCSESCQEMADVYGDGNKIKKSEKLVEKANFERQIKGTSDDYEKACETAQEAQNVINDVSPEGSECTEAGKVYNDLGLLMTQLHKFEEALVCFEKAVELVRTSEPTNRQLEAVVLQNLGAGYNFNKDYQRAIKFHEDAAKIYGEINFTNGRGQCYTNLAYAYSQLGNAEDAKIYYRLALEASKDTRDQNMEWQALEGLGAVWYNSREFRRAQDAFIGALQCVGSNREATLRITEKMKQAMRSEQQAEWGYRLPLLDSGTSYRLSKSPRPGSVDLNRLESQIIPETATNETRQQPGKMAEQEQSMATVRDEHGRRHLPVRKKDSIGPYHHPKVSRGLGSLTTDSPRFRNSMVPNRQLLEGETETSESSSDSDDDTGSSSSETESSEAEQEDPAGGTFSSAKIDQIFAKRSSQTDRQQTVVEPEPEDTIDQYQKNIAMKDKSEQEGSGDSETEDRTPDSESDSPPPVPVDSPPHTVTGQHESTYLQPAAGGQHNTTVHQTTAQVHQYKPSFDRPESPQSPRQVPREQSTPKQPGAGMSGYGNHNGDDSDYNGNDAQGRQQSDPNYEDNEPPYASIDTMTRSKPASARAVPTGEGNHSSNGQHSRQKPMDRQRSQNFFDDDEPGQLDQATEIESEARPRAGVSSSEKSNLDQLPRGQREQYLSQQHHQLQMQAGPALPPREEKQSKTCVVM